MVQVRYLLVTSLTSAVFCALVKAACVQEPACLKTRVLLSSPEVPKKGCATCGAPSSSEVQKEAYVLVPIKSESSDNQPQIGVYRPQGYVPGSSYTQKQGQNPSRYPEDAGYRKHHQPSRPSKETGYGRGSHDTAPYSGSITSCQSNYYLLQSSTQVINNIQQPSDQTSQSYSRVPPVGKSIGTQLSYPRKQDRNPRPSKAQGGISNQQTPLHHLSASKRARPLIENQPIDKPDKLKYQPLRVYLTKPSVSEYSSSSLPKETKENYAGKTSCGKNKSDEKKLGYGKTSPKESFQISCQKCQKTSFGSATKDNRGSRGQY